MTKAELTALIKTKEDILLNTEKEIDATERKINLLSEEIKKLKAQLNKIAGDMVLLSKLSKSEYDCNKLIRKNEDNKKEVQRLHLEIGKLSRDRKIASN